MALLAIMAALATAEPNASELGFRAFETMCVATGGDPATSISAADKAGWAAIPEDARQRFGAGVDDPSTFQARISRTDGGFMVLGVDRSSRNIRGDVLVANHCQLSFTPGDYAVVVSLAKDWAAVPPVQGVPPTGTEFVFADDHGHHTALTGTELESATGGVMTRRRITQLTVFNLSRGPSLRLDIPVR